MTLFKRELILNLKSLIIWAVCILLLLTMFMLLYPTFAKQMDTLDEMLENLPQEMTKMMNMDSIDFTDITDYFAYVHQYVLLAVFIQFMLMGANLLSKEEDLGTINFLYAKPISKSNIVISKFLSAAAYALFMSALLAAVSLLLIDILAPGTGGKGPVLLLYTATFIGEMFFVAMGMLVSVFIKKGRTVMSISIGVVMCTYIFSMAANVSESMEFLSYLSPFKYFEASAVLHSSKLDGLYTVIAFSVILVCMTFALLSYNRRDLKC